jgi:HAD superfamily hydrolase (TIGR01509 family)
VLFDLDGTLVQTERLKAISYARAAVAIRPELVLETVYAAFGDVVGQPRQEVATALVDRFGLGVSWSVYAARRLAIYEEMLADPATLRAHQWPHTLDLLGSARAGCDQVGLATMSHRPQVVRVLQALGLEATFDTVATRDDVVQGKPDPEIYLLVAERFERPVSECLVIEDSPAGVEAALRAGMRCVAVTTPFTRDRLHAGGLLPPADIVDDPTRLCAVVARVIQEESSAHEG